MLTEKDVTDLIALRAWTHGKTYEDLSCCLAELREKEDALSDDALHAWKFWPSRKLAEELNRWRPKFLVRRSSIGYRAYRWIANKGMYAKKACATQLTATEAEVFRAELIRT